MALQLRLGAFERAFDPALGMGIRLADDIERAARHWIEHRRAVRDAIMAQRIIMPTTAIRLCGPVLEASSERLKIGLANDQCGLAMDILCQRRRAGEFV